MFPPFIFVFNLLPFIPPYFGFLWSSIIPCLISFLHYHLSFPSPPLDFSFPFSFSSSYYTLSLSLSSTLSAMLSFLKFEFCFILFFFSFFFFQWQLLRSARQISSGIVPAAWKKIDEKKKKKNKVISTSSDFQVKIVFNVINWWQDLVESRWRWGRSCNTQHHSIKRQWEKRERRKASFHPHPNILILKLVGSESPK